MSKIVLFFLIAGLSHQAFAQIMFVERAEVESKYQENSFMILPRPEGLVAFRAQPEKGFNLRTSLQYFLTDLQLQKGDLHQIRIKDNFDLAGYEIEGDYFYALMQKGSAITSDRYIIEVDLNTQDAKEIPMENIYSMDLKEFFVLDRNAVFMGISEGRPVIQIFDMDANNVYTVQGIYGKDSKVLQLRKDSELGVIDVLLSKRDKYKMKQITVLTFDEFGNKVREVNIDKTRDSNLELVEGILTPIQNYQQSLIGVYGQRRREAYHGIYLTDINEFGEYDIKYYTMEDFPNFYNYLNERQRLRKQREVERSIEREKPITIKPVLSTREIIPTDLGFLIYNDHFTATNARYIPRDGVYANHAYRFNPSRIYMNPMMYGGAYGSQLYPGSMNAPLGNTWQTEGEYKFASAYFIYLNREGNVIWDNAVNLQNKVTGIPGKFGEVSFDGQRLHYAFLDELNINLSYVNNGEVVFENKSFEIELIDESERIRDTQGYSLNLTWWYSDYFLLTGKQKIRYLNQSGREDTREVFFMTKIKADGDLYVPEEVESTD